MTTPQERIRLAHLATLRCDELMWKAIETLTDAVRAPGNGAGIYPDPGMVQSKLRAATDLVADVRQIMTSTKWPSNEDYDQ